MRSEHTFKVLYEEDLVPLQLPHVRKPSKRYGGPAQHHTPATPEEFFREEFFQAIDTVTSYLTDRFDQEGLTNLVMPENLLICGNIRNSTDMLGLYPELDKQALQIQFAMLKSNHQFNTTK